MMHIDDLVLHTDLSECVGGGAHLVVGEAGVAPVGHKRQRHVDRVEETAAVPRHLRQTWTHKRKTFRECGLYGVGPVNAPPRTFGRHRLEVGQEQAHTQRG
jgi:hypothetical protein